MNGKWYLKTFRIFDSPKKDVPDIPVVPQSFYTSEAEEIIRKHNQVVDEFQAENKELKEDVIRCGKNWKARYCEVKEKLDAIEQVLKPKEAKE